MATYHSQYGGWRESTCIVLGHKKLNTSVVGRAGHGNRARRKEVGNHEIGSVAFDQERSGMSQAVLDTNGGNNRYRIDGPCFQVFNFF